MISKSSELFADTNSVTGQLSCIKGVVSPTRSDDRTGGLAPHQRREILGRKTAIAGRRKERETARAPKGRGNEGERPSTVQRHPKQNRKHKYELGV